MKSCTVSTYLRVVKCNGAYICVKLISEIGRLQGVVSLSCEERREGGGRIRAQRGGGHKREPREGVGISAEGIDRAPRGGRQGTAPWLEIFSL